MVLRLKAGISNSINSLLQGVIIDNCQWETLWIVFTYSEFDVFGGIMTMMREDEEWVPNQQ